MPTALPQRPPEHQLEETSISFFKQHLPQGWILEEPRPDYGIDVRVGIVDNNQLTGREFIVQVKASPTREAGNTVKLVLKVTTLNYLRHSLNVALVVKYVAAEQQAYWMLLKDFKLQPRPGQKTVTIRIPCANRISDNPWTRIAKHVEHVHYKKLRANVTDP